MARTIMIITFCALVACDGDRSPDRGPGDGSPSTLGSAEHHLAREEIEAGRRDPSWRRVVGLDDPAVAGDSSASPESLDDIDPGTLHESPTHLPVGENMEGPSVLRVQVLLDRALFSPGIIDGSWGKNTEKAVYWLQRREGLEPTGTVDQPTFERLQVLAGRPDSVARHRALTAEDVEGPFIDLPSDVYERAEMECLCYESLSEKLAERFHTSPDLLQRLNPEVDLNTLQAGDRIMAPDVRAESAAAEARVARLRISDAGHFVHALDSAGVVLFHFPSTLGSAYDPSPSGDFAVTSVTEDPWWHYQPSILEDVPDDEPEAKLPPGPNNAVGLVWMALSEPHYGIHGTKAPETIGYSTSAGCVRLTNWDALFLARRMDPPVPVSFTDVE